MSDHSPEYDAVAARLDSGELYVDYGPGLDELDAERQRGKELVYDYNATRPGELARRTQILTELIGTLGEGAWIEPPLRVMYGSHVHLGTGFYANVGCVLVDDAQIHVGDRVMFGPNVTLSTAGHPVAPELRVGGRQFSLPITIGDDVWLGAGVVVLPGVTIGDGTVVGAGSVVTRSLPTGVVATGVPARVVRPIGPEDRDFVRREPR